MLKEIKLYPKYVSMSLRSTLSYRMDAVIQLLGFFITNIISILTLYFTISAVPSIGDFTFERIAFLYGFILLPKAIDHILFDNLWILAWSGIRTGDLDFYLTRPINPLYQYLAKTFKWDGIGDLVVGIVLISVFGPLATINFTVEGVIGLVICGILGISVFFCTKLIFASLAFWVKNVGPILTNVYNFSEYAKYPIRYMGKAFCAILFYVIPFGLFLYYPVECLILEANIWHAVLYSFIGAAIMLTLSFTIWHIGIKRYDSSGN